MAGLSQPAAPLSVTLHQRSRQLEVVFSDGVVVRLPFELMRVYSPSAEVQGHAPDQAVLQTGHRWVSIDALEPVGHYGLKPTFSDGHDTGIFTWEYIRQLSADQDSLWRTYESRLQEVGASRDTALPASVPRSCRTDHDR